jgi:hypothetical protein
MRVQARVANHLPEPSELAGAREVAGVDVMEVADSVGGGGDSEMKGPSMYLDLVTWTGYLG